jgi:hypothetical protein
MIHPFTLILILNEDLDRSAGVIFSFSHTQAGKLHIIYRPASIYGKRRIYDPSNSYAVYFK